MKGVSLVSAVLSLFIWQGHCAPVKSAHVAANVKTGTGVIAGNSGTQLVFIDKGIEADHRIRTKGKKSRSRPAGLKAGVTIKLWTLTNEPTVKIALQWDSVFLYTVLHPCDLGRFFSYRRTFITVSSSQKQESRVGVSPAGVKFHGELIRKDGKGGKGELGVRVCVPAELLALL